jgi:hypothetical protein
MFGNLIDDVKKGAMTLLPKIQNHSKKQSRYQVAGMILAQRIAQDPDLMISSRLIAEASKACIMAAQILEKEIDRAEPEVISEE